MDRDCPDVLCRRMAVRVRLLGPVTTAILIPVLACFDPLTGWMDLVDCALAKVEGHIHFN
jgi:hypothetical protein